MNWDKGQVKSFVKQVRAEVGDGWVWITPRVRHALVAERAFAVVRGQAAESVRVEEMDALLDAMLKEAGVT